ncbi:MAG TPA: oligosaccharide flippase family protein, partial [Zeimonas sp.]|nr:oligosaccharide flippase family protein [Zeimonas sp.]
MADALTQVPRRRTSILRGAMLTVGMRWTDRLIGFVSTLILARLLVPDDFGVIAAASLVIAFIEVMSELGVHVALIQNRNTTQAHFDTAWTIRLLQGVATSVLIAAAAPYGAQYFDDPRLTLVLQLMAIGVAVSAFENIGVIEFQKEMRFDDDFRFVFLKRIVRFVITIAAAWYLRNYWAFVVAALAGRLFAVALSYLLHPMRPRWSFEKWREILGISQWMLVRSIGMYLNGGLHRIVVGGRGDAAVLGGYTMANEISALP